MSNIIYINSKEGGKDFYALRSPEIRYAHTSSIFWNKYSHLVDEIALPSP